MIYGGDLMSNFAGSVQSGDAKMTKGVIISKLAKIIENEPKELIKALKESGVSIDDKTSVSNLIDKSVSSLYENEKFREEVAKLMILSSQKFSNIGGEGGFDFSSISNLFGGGGDSSGGSGGGVSTPNVTVGADPVSAIAGAIGSIFSFGTSIKQSKAQEEADKRALQMQLLEGEEKKTNWLPIVIIGGVLAIGGMVAYITLKKK